MSRTDRIAAPIMSTYRYFGALRFMLASLVMFQHFAASIAPLYFTERVQPYEPGSLAVLVFFCLSGFVISEAIDLAYLKKPIAFLSNRCLRILPHFVIALGLSVAVHYYFSEVGSLVVARATPPHWKIYLPPTICCRISLVSYRRRMATLRTPIDLFRSCGPCGSRSRITSSCFWYLQHLGCLSFGREQIFENY